MADLFSPGVQVKEKDLTTTVRSEPTSIGGIVGVLPTPSRWSPSVEGRHRGA